MYYVMIAIVLLLVIVPLLWLPNPGAVTTGLLATLAGVIAWVIGFIPLPKTAQIGQFWTQHAEWLFALLAAYVLTYRGSTLVARAMQAKAQEVWTHVAGTTAEPSVEATAADRLASAQAPK